MITILLFIVCTSYYWKIETHDLVCFALSYGCEEIGNFAKNFLLHGIGPYSAHNSTFSCLYSIEFFLLYHFWVFRKSWKENCYKKIIGILKLIISSTLDSTIWWVIQLCSTLSTESFVIIHAFAKKGSASLLTTIRVFHLDTAVKNYLYYHLFIII